MAEHTSEFIEVAGCKVEVLRGGQGPVLLFLHGAGGASNWAPYMDRLAETFDVIVPSHPGFGRSDINWGAGRGGGAVGISVFKGLGS